MQLENYPNVDTHKGLQLASQNILKWSGGTAIDTPTTGTPRMVEKMTGGKLGKVQDGWMRARGGRGKQDDVLVYKGKIYFVDYKVKKDVQKDEQVKFQKRIEHAGGTYLIIKHPDEIFALLDEINAQQSLF